MKVAIQSKYQWLDVPFDTIEKQIRILLKKGLIEHRGSKKTGGYYPVKQ